jgi:carbonic anhydrase
MNRTRPDDEGDAGHTYEAVEAAVDRRDDWARRRQKGIPNDERLMVVACMDERLPVEDALGIGPGDAHVFRNAGGIVTDDVVRSAALTTNFFGTTEVVVVTHTDCGMMSATDEAIVGGLEAAAGDSLATLELNPALPGFRLGDAPAADWIGAFDDVDEACTTQVDYLDGHPLLPDGVTVRGYVYEVESGELRRPGDRIAATVNTRSA